MTDLTKQLLRFRRRKIGNDIQSIAWIGLSALFITVIILLGLEAIFWLSTWVRYAVWLAGLIVVTALAVALGVCALLIKRNRISRYALSSVAREIGNRGLEKEDEVLNALQLESTSLQEYRSSQQLARQFVRQIAARLENLNPADIYGRRAAPRFRTFAGIITAVSLMLLALFYPSLRTAGAHWLHPKTNYPVPHPFEIESLSGNLSLMGGDEATITLAATGKIPGSIELEIKGPEKTSYAVLNRDDEGRFTHTLADVFQNLHYRGFARSKHFWEPWNEISSPSYTIDVTDRPAIEEFLMTLSPPDYTGMSPMSQKGNVAEIRGLMGSTLEIELRSDKVLSRAHLKYVPSETGGNPLKVQMQTSRNRAYGKFTLKEDGVFETYIFDERNISNLDPIQYHFMMIEDMPPELQVLEPTSPMELGSDFMIPTRLHIEDDFGFSNLQIVYEREHPQYVYSGGSESNEPSPNVVNIHRIDAFSREETSQDVFYLWDVNSFNLMPEDELRFHFELYDNDEISGPKKSVSPTLVARFPSLADLFARTVEEEQFVEEEAEDIVEHLRELEDVLREVELEVLKTEKVSWEQEQTVTESVEEVRKRLENVQSLQEKLQEIVDQSGKHSLFSPELIEKFKSLQELLQDIITPELEASMEKVRQALHDLPPDELLNALQDFRLNTEELEEQLDRFIDIFRRIRAEQTVDQLVTRMEYVVQQEENLIEKLDPNETALNLPRLAGEQDRNSREFENIRDLMGEASRSMDAFAPIPAHDLTDLAQSELTDRTARELRSTSRALERGDAAEGLLSAGSASENLRQMLSRLEEIRDLFRQQTVHDMVKKFENILRNTLFISKEQERLQLETKDAPRNSPRLAEQANRQQLLRDQLSQLIMSLMELSHETFAVTPEMGKAIGRATAGMNESLKKLEERNGQLAAQSQKNTVGALNETALATLAAIEDIQKSGMASGLQQFLERMEQMASRQKGINAQTLQLALGQMMAMEQENLMRRLARDQEGLRKSLDQLRREMRGWKGGDGNLQGILDDMEEVVKEFKARNVNRKTMERQQRILTRMLDSQKSLRRQDFEEKRRATTAQDILREGPSGLPDDLGQRRNIVMEALNLAVKAGYSRDYQEMIRRYFNALIESDYLAREGDHEEE